jgi:hypothetical protein
VQTLSAASPEKTFQRLPPPRSNPISRESRSSSARAVLMLLETISLPASLSNQR